MLGRDSSKPLGSEHEKNGGQGAGGVGMPESLESFADRFEQAVAAQPGIAGAVDPLADALFSEELVRDVAGIPYQLVAVSTGHEHWPLADKERAALGKVGSLYLRHRVKLDPAKALDFFFWGTLFAFTAPRAVKEVGLVLAEMRRNDKAGDAKPGKETDGPAKKD